MHNPLVRRTVVGKINVSHLLHGTFVVSLSLPLCYASEAREIGERVRRAIPKPLLVCDGLPPIMAQGVLVITAEVYSGNIPKQVFTRPLLPGRIRTDLQQRYASAIDYCHTVDTAYIARLTCSR